MKSYTITVNGNVYDVTVEENGAQEALRLRQEQQEKYLRSSLLLAHL